MHQIVTDICRQAQKIIGKTSQNLFDMIRNTSTHILAYMHAPKAFFSRHIYTDKFNHDNRAGFKNGKYFIHFFLSLKVLNYARQPHALGRSAAQRCTGSSGIFFFPWVAFRHCSVSIMYRSNFSYLYRHPIRSIEIDHNKARADQHAPLAVKTE